VGGTGFIPGARRDTVILMGDRTPAVFAFAEQATTTRLVVRVPEKLRAFLTMRDGRPVPTRFALRVLGRRLSVLPTPSRLSPLIDGGRAATTSSAPGASTSTAADVADAPKAAPAAQSPSPSSQVASP
jgi:hypothetical protein